jgi:hypothetical protein
VRGEDGQVLRGRAALEQRHKQLRERERFTAAEIESDGLVDHVRATRGNEAADQLRAELDEMEAHGYKLVHGVEFLMPHDLTQIPAFESFGRETMNAVTIGNFFGRRPPIQMRYLEERRQRAALAKSLGSRGVQVDPDDETVTNLLDDLIREVLMPMQDSISSRLEEQHLMSFWERKRLALDSTFTPLRVEDLVTKKARVFKILEARGWDQNTIEAAYAALPEMRNASFKDLGLYAIEARMRQRNELVQALKFLSGTKYGDGILAHGTQGRRVGALAGFAQGQAMADEDASLEERLGRGIVGGAIGAAAGTAVNAAVSPMIAKSIPKAELFRYGQLGNEYARLRDAMRFSLSPIFDISRYTEGYMLSNTAAPLRRADGSRLALPGNMSPASTRKRLAKTFVEKGGDPSLANNYARQQFDIHRAEFTAASRGEFDPEVLDPAGRWFQQIGIMGFNPTDWMTSMFATLRAEGLSADEAYRHAKGAYTYGTRGRSAAEMSVNFVFFPFSFQKKAFGHIAKWMNDDLSRSIILHDAFKTYEALDERYDLDTYWKEHLPALQQLQRLNLMAFGLSPGRFGGINAQLFETTYKTSSALFMPWGGNLSNEDDRLELQKLVRTLMPAINDINWMVENVKEQGNVVFSPAHTTSRAQVTRGYDEWNEYRNELTGVLRSQGLEWTDLRKPYLEDMRLAYEAKRAEIASKYPAWAKHRAENVANITALETERNDRIARAISDPVNASETDIMLYEFESELEQMKRTLELQGVSVSGPDGWTDAPPSASEYLIRKAVEMREANPAFYGVYRKFYEKQLGPIEAKI